METSLDTYVQPLDGILLAKLHALPFSSCDASSGSLWSEILLKVKRKYFPKLYQVPSKIEWINRLASVKYANGLQIDCVFFEKYKWLPTMVYRDNFKVLQSSLDLHNLRTENPYYTIIEASKILDIGPCPYQLPPKWCNKIYKSGESFMGDWYFFSIIFKDGRKKDYLTSPYVDLIKLPAGYSFDDIIDVKPLLKRQNAKPSDIHEIPFVYCYYK